MQGREQGLPRQSTTRASMGQADMGAQLWKERPVGMHVLSMYWLRAHPPGYANLEQTLVEDSN